MRKIPENTEYFNYYQNNPKNKNTGDCVIRTLALAMNKTWDEVFKDLCELAIKNKMMPNNISIYTKYLKSNGWIKYKQPRKKDNKRYKVWEFLKTAEYKLNLLEYNVIAHVGSNHISCIKEHKVWDIWNCSTKVMGVYWIKE